MFRGNSLFLVEKGSRNVLNVPPYSPFLPLCGDAEIVFIMMEDGRLLKFW
jgi:hypothetical protein